MFWNLVEVVVARHGECTRCHRTFHFKTANFMLCDVPLNKNTRVKIKKKTDAEKENLAASVCPPSWRGWGGGHTLSSRRGEGPWGRGPGLGVLGTGCANVSACRGVPAGRSAGLSKAFCQGLKGGRGPPPPAPLPRPPTPGAEQSWACCSQQSQPRVSRKHGQVGLPARRREEAP